MPGAHECVGTIRCTCVRASAVCAGADVDTYAQERAGAEHNRVQPSRMFTCSTYIARRQLPDPSLINSN